MIRTAVFAAALAIGASALAQTAAPAAKPAAKPATTKPAATAKKAAPAATKPLPAADQAQLDAAERAHLGDYECDFNQSITVSKNAKYPGYVDVVFKGKTFVTKPVLSSTGALRLEDVNGIGLMLQIANKSMLMDTRAGVRLVDACTHEKQRAFMAAQPK
jgi:membrane-bound inhibitor of C-type lysozyme